MSYRQILRNAFIGDAPIKQYESYTLAMSSVSMFIHLYNLLVQLRQGVGVLAAPSLETSLVPDSPQATHGGKRC